MFKNVLTKTLFGLRWQLVGWGLAVFLIVFLTMSVFNALSHNGIEQIVGGTPDSLKSLIGSVADYTTIPGYIGQQVFGPNLVIFTMIMSVLLFLNVSASKEDNGQTRTSLTFPVSRSKFYFETLLATLLIIAVVCLLILPGLELGLLVVGHSADWGRILLSVMACFLMNSAYGLVSFGAAMATGKKSLSIALAAGYAAASFIVSSLAPAVSWLKWPDKFSVFHYYNNPQIMSAGMDWTHFWVLVVVCAGLTLIGWLGFTRRDISA